MRIPKPFFREQTQTWYVQIGKKQHNLGKDKDKAQTKYHRLMSGRQDVTDDTQVFVVFLQFLEWNKANKAPGTHEFYKRHINSFAEFIGQNLTVGDLKPYHVTRWLAQEYKGTSGNYRRSAIRSLQRAFNWAVKEGHLAKSPLAHVVKPPYTPRDAIVTPEQWDQLTAALQQRGEPGQRFLELLTLMRQTGCRPLEARTAEARHVDRKGKCLIFERTETKGYGSDHTVERRVIPLTDDVFAICCRLAVKYPTGPLFRNSNGEPWTRYDIKSWFKRLDGSRAAGRGTKRPSKKLKLDCRIKAASIRHTWATEALERGVDPITVATIMGHKDLTMLMKVYQHLKKKDAHLRNALHQAIGITPPVSVPA